MANKIQDAFDSIQADTRLKESTKQFVREAHAKKSRAKAHKTYRRLLAAACMVLFLLAGTGGYAWVRIPVSYVSIDINPSIELALNRLDRVVYAAAYNTQGEEILKNLAIKGEKYTTAVEAILASKAMSAYLAEESELVFTIAADGSHYRSLQEGVETCSGKIGYESHSINADPEIISSAHACGLSLGKYYAWQQLIQYDDSITADECENMSMTKIHGLIREHEQEEEHKQDQEHEQEEEHKKDKEPEQEESQKQGCGQNGENEQNGEPDEQQEEQQVQEKEQENSGESITQQDDLPTDNHHHNESCHE